MIERGAAVCRPTMAGSGGEKDLVGGRGPVSCSRICSHSLAVTAMLAGDLARARRAAEQARDAFRRLGDALYTSVATCTLAEIDLRDGHVERSVAASQAEIRTWVRGVCPSLSVRLGLRVTLARGLAILGHQDAAWEALEAARSMPDVATLPPCDKVMIPAAEAELAALFGDEEPG